LSAISQSTGNQNFDFTQGNFNHWICKTANTSGGTAYSTLSWTGNTPVINRHTIMTNINGYDSVIYSNSAQFQLPLIPDGFNFSAQIGSFKSPQAQSIIYPLSVDSNHALITLHYAIVLKDPYHPFNFQPYITIRIQDTNGILLSGICNNYTIYPDSGTIPFQHGANNIKWLDWNTLSLDLSSLIGQNVEILIATAACGHPDYFCYCYLVGESNPLKIKQQYCQNTIYARLEAPDGFISYLWKDSNNHTVGNTQSIKIPNAQVGTAYTVTMTNLLGCTTSIHAIIKKDSLKASFICDSLNSRCYPTRVRLIETSTYNTDYISGREWIIQKTSTSSPIEYTGTDSIFEYTFQDTGYYKIFHTVFTNSGCPDTVSVMVYSYPDLQDSIIPDFTYTLHPNLCSDSIVCHNNSYSKNPIRFSVWTIKNEQTAETLFTTYDSVLNYNFQNRGLYRIILGVYTYGCGDTVSRLISIYNNEIFDTSFCSYTWNDSLYTQSGTYLQTFQGVNCDSIVLLHLIILDSIPFNSKTIYGDTILWQPGTYTYGILPIKGASAYHWWVNTLHSNENTEKIYDSITTDPSFQLIISAPNISTIYVEVLSICDTLLAAQLTIEYPDGILQYNELEYILIYPNPTTDQLFIKSEGLIIQEIKLYSVLGKELFTKRIESSETTLQTGHLAPGLYFVHIKTDKGIIVRKISKE